jgi:hypothetical protein
LSAGYNANPNPPTIQCRLVNSSFADWDYNSLSPTKCSAGMSAIRELSLVDNVFDSVVFPQAYSEAQYRAFREEKLLHAMPEPQRPDNIHML